MHRRSSCSDVRAGVRRRHAAAVAALLATAGCARAPASVGATPVAEPRTSAAAAALPAGPLSLGRALTPAERAWVDRTLESLSLRDRVAQMVTVWVLGDYANASDPSYLKIRQYIERDHVGGVVMSLGSPIEVAAKVNAMQRLSRVPLLVSSDLEPGLGRLEGGFFSNSTTSAGSATVLPSNMAIGAGARESDALEAGRIVGREARAVGIHLAFAPTVDVNNNPANPVINTRSFGEDPRAVARLASAFVRGLQAEGVAATAKHFPGHGDTDTDSHNALPVVRSDRAQMNAVELVPFRAAIDAGVVGIMTAHIALPAVEGDNTPATLSPRIMTGLLRDSLGFRGLAVTDAMTMEGVGQGYPLARSSVLAVQAGNDILLMPRDVPPLLDAVTAAVERGEITRERIDASVRRILELKVRAGAVSRPIVSLDTLREVVGAPAHWSIADSIAAHGVTLLRDSLGLVPTGAGRTFTVVTYAPELETVAGTAFTAALRTGAKSVRVVRVTPRTSRAELDSIASVAATSDRIVVHTYTRTLEGEGRIAIPAQVAAFVDALTPSGKLIVVAGGNPYVLRQFPRASTYLVTYGRGEALERAAAHAVLGRAPIVGRAPISLPGLFARGDGIQRGASR
jgi:beta-N-acetylhexosaminidase